MTLLDKLEWALDTVRSQLKFGLPEEQAIKQRECRVRGVLVDAVKEVAQMRDDFESCLNDLESFLTEFDSPSYKEGLEKLEELRNKYGIKAQ